MYYFDLPYTMTLNKILLLFTGSEYVENAPLEVCAKLVIDSKRERRQQEEREKSKRQDEEAAQRKKDFHEYKEESDDERESKVEKTRKLLKSISSDG